jgi:pimeloyl-ACP methyl ester carboxylesterase
MAWIQGQLPRLADIPIQLVWAQEDQVFPIEYAERLKALLPHAEGPSLYDKAAHFLQDDRGPEIAAEIVKFLDRTVGARP